MEISGKSKITQDGTVIGILRDGEDPTSYNERSFPIFHKGFNLITSTTKNGPRRTICQHPSSVAPKLLRQTASIIKQILSELPSMQGSAIKIIRDVLKVPLPKWLLDFSTVVSSLESGKESDVLEFIGTSKLALTLFSKFKTPSLKLQIGKEDASKLLGKTKVGGDLTFPKYKGLESKYVGPIKYTRKTADFKTSVFYVKSLLMKNGEVLSHRFLVKSHHNVYTSPFPPTMSGCKTDVSGTKTCTKILSSPSKNDYDCGQAILDNDLNLHHKCDTQLPQEPVFGFIQKCEKWGGPKAAVASKDATSITKMCSQKQEMLNLVIGNNFFDTSCPLYKGDRLIVKSIQNLIIDGYHPIPSPILVDDTDFFPSLSEEQIFMGFLGVGIMGIIIVLVLCGFCCKKRCKICQREEEEEDKRRKSNQPTSTEFRMPG